MRLPAVIPAILFAGLVGSAAQAQPIGWILPENFWNHWGDGQAEIAAYDLEIERYGELRSGTAVAIFVTEPFSVSDRVKAESARSEMDVIQVLKLNLIRDFPTGVYDYNVMSSSFVALENRPGIASGQIVKSTFSAQEWCGHVFQEVIPRGSSVVVEIRSYFDGEQGSARLPWDEDSMAADALFHWARGLALPRVSAGGSVKGRMLESSMTGRLRHEPAGMIAATLSRSSSTETIEVPAGTFEVRQARAETGDDVWTFWVETAPPHRIVKWSLAGLESATLLRVERMPYWKMNGNDFREAVRKLGMKPRPARTM